MGGKFVVVATAAGPNRREWTGRRERTGRPEWTGHPHPAAPRGGPRDGVGRRLLRMLVALTLLGLAFGTDGWRSPPAGPVAAGLPTTIVATTSDVVVPAPGLAGVEAVNVDTDASPQEHASPMAVAPGRARLTAVTVVLTAATAVDRAGRDRAVPPAAAPRAPPSFDA